MLRESHFSYFQNSQCEFFPCHETEHPENFNCLFCYCPLYALGKKCGGNFKYIAGGVKDCSECLVPHKKENYAYITSRYCEIMDLVRENDEK